MPPAVVYYVRKCISCLNKVTLAVTLPNPFTETECTHCRAIIRIWP